MLYRKRSGVVTEGFILIYNGLLLKYSTGTWKNRKNLFSSNKTNSDSFSC